mgnify:CR=1 FL=1
MVAETSKASKKVAKSDNSGKSSMKSETKKPKAVKAGADGTSSKNGAAAAKRKAGAVKTKAASSSSKAKGKTSVTKKKIPAKAVGARRVGKASPAKKAGVAKSKGKSTKKSATTVAKGKGNGKDKAKDRKAASGKGGKGKKSAAAAKDTKKKAKKKKPVQRKKLTPEEKEQRVKEKAERLAKRDRLYVKGWEGNSDSDGSVDTGALEENVCFECGECTTDEPDWDSLVICDRCSGDYHLKCVGLDIVPRKGWICPRCKADEYSFAGLKYNVYKPDIYGVSGLMKNAKSLPKVEQDGFALPKPKKDFAVEQCFSPARPIHLAWQEMMEKGFMCVSRVFPHDVLKKLTHGSVERATQSGRAGNVWRGALPEVEMKLNGGSCHNMIDRDGRYDMRLPEFVIESLGLNELLEPIISRLRTVMGNPTPQIRTQNVVFVPVGSPSQPWHADDCMHDLKHYRYFTILIHLNPIDENCGGTEIWSKKAQRGDMIRNRPGDAFVFHGSLQHRGQANLGYSHRLFYYASFACRQDQNIGF